MYKSEFSAEKLQVWLLFNNGHADLITNIVGFLGVKYFCSKCCIAFTHSDAFKIHKCQEYDEVVCQECNEDTDDEDDDTSKHKKKKSATKYMRFAKDSSKYMRMNFTKGSNEHIKHMVEKRLSNNKRQLTTEEIK